MTDIVVSEESAEFAKLARDFAAGEIKGQSSRLDEEGHFPLDLFRKAWEIGLVNPFIPEEFGGLQLSVLDTCLIQEEIARACPAVAAVFAGNLLAAALIMTGGRQDQKEKYLSMLTGNPAVAGSLLLRAATGFTRPASATRKGDRWYVTAADTTGFSLKQAGFVILITESDEGQTAFIVDGLPENAHCQPFPRMGLRACDIETVSFEMELSGDNVLGTPHRAGELIADAAALSGPAFSACAVGCAQAALDHSIVYSKERLTFGKPISSYQAVSFMLADMARGAEAARLLTLRAAGLADAGLPNEMEAKIAWTAAVEQANRAACDAVQVFGGYGYSREYPVEKLMRDAKMLQILADTSHDVKASLGRELLVR